MKYWLIIGLFSAMIILTGCSQTATNGNAQLANPASVFCEKNGGKVEIVTASDGSQSGNCILQNGTVCDEWSYFRGGCALKQCGECPQFTSMYPDACRNGTIVAGEKDECGCYGPQRCLR